MNDVRKGIDETLKVKLGEATGKDWMDEAAKLPEDVKKKYAEAIDVLLSWPMFKEEWGWTGVQSLRHILTYAITGKPSVAGSVKSEEPAKSEELPKE